MNTKSHEFKNFTIKNMSKKITTLFIFLFVVSSFFAQVPQKMSYQAVIRDAQNQLIANNTVGMRLSILQGSSTGAAVYVETQTPVTNANGLISIEIGAGNVISGSFASIDWSNNTFFLETEVDAQGGTNYTISGTSQLLSVPYALHAKTAESVTGSVTGPTPTVTTIAPTNVLATAVNTGLTILNNGNEFILASGICYNTTGTPTINNTTYSTFGTWTGTSLNNLSPSTTYFARAFATNSNGTSYGNEISFTTISGNVIITTNPITNVTDSSFVTGGNISSDGGASITQRGVCWSTTNTNPTIGTNNFTTNATGSGSYTSNVDWPINPNTLYYVRAYAINSVGTFYGNTQSATTLSNCSNLGDTCTVSSSYGNIAGHGGSVYVYSGGNPTNINFSLYNLNLPISCSAYISFSGSLNCSNSTFTIPSQSYDGCVISGSGFYNTTFDQLTVTYTIVSGGNTYNCTTVFTHLN
jgi:hypothetical protein